MALRKENIDSFECRDVVPEWRDTWRIGAEHMLRQSDRSLKSNPVVVDVNTGQVVYVANDIGAAIECVLQRDGNIYAGENSHVILTETDTKAARTQQAKGEAEWARVKKNMGFGGYRPYMPDTEGDTAFCGMADVG